MCTPIAEFPAWDPAGAYADVFMGLFKRPACKDPVWSPETVDEMRRARWQNSRNTTSSASSAATATRTSPRGARRRRTGSCPDWAMASTSCVDAAAVARAKAMKDRGELVVLAGNRAPVLGIAPTDPRLEPFWQMAEDLDLPVGIHRHRSAGHALPRAAAEGLTGRACTARW